MRDLVLNQILIMNKVLLNSLKMQMMEKLVLKVNKKVRLPKYPHGDIDLLTPCIISSHLWILQFKLDPR